MDIDISQIKLINENKYIKVLYNDSPIEIDTPELTAMFGLEKMYDTYIVKLVLNNELQTFIEIFESHINNLPNFKDNNIKSSIIKKDNYPDMLLVKLISYRDKISTKVTNSEGHYNIFNLKKNTKVKCKLVIDSIWYYKGKYTYKIKLKELFIL